MLKNKRYSKFHGFWHLFLVCIVPSIISCGLTGEIKTDESQISSDDKKKVFLEIFEGDQQVGSVGSVFKNSIRVRAIDKDGDPVIGKAVLFSILEGEATVLTEMPAFTNEAGIAEADIEAGENASSIRIEATLRVAGEALDQHSVEFQLISFIEGEAQLLPHSDSSTNLSGYAKSELPTPLAVVVLDGFGNYVKGQSISFEILKGDLTLSQNRAMTNDQGKAQTIAELGETAGDGLVRAAWVDSENEIDVQLDFKVKIKPAAAAILELISGHLIGADRPCTIEESSFDSPITLLITDQCGNPHEGIRVEVNPDTNSAVGDGVLGEPATTDPTDADGKTDFQIRAGSIGSNSSCGTGSDQDVGYCQSTTIQIRALDTENPLERTATLNFTKEIHFVRYNTGIYPTAIPNGIISVRCNTMNFEVRALAYRACWDNIPEDEVELTWFRKTPQGLCSYENHQFTFWNVFDGQTLCDGFWHHGEGGFIDLNIRSSITDVNTDLIVSTWLQINVPGADPLDFYLDAPSCHE